jgi:hypothetical protein
MTGPGGERLMRVNAPIYSLNAGEMSQQIPSQINAKVWPLSPGRSVLRCDNENWG